jgi:hypothetical protein
VDVPVIDLVVGGCGELVLCYRTGHADGAHRSPREQPAEQPQYALPWSEASQILGSLHKPRFDFITDLPAANSTQHTPNHNEHEVRRRERAATDERRAGAHAMHMRAGAGSEARPSLNLPHSGGKGEYGQLSAPMILTN